MHSLCHTTPDLQSGCFLHCILAQVKAGFCQWLAQTAFRQTNDHSPANSSLIISLAFLRTPLFALLVAKLWFLLHLILFGGLQVFAYFLPSLFSFIEPLLLKSLYRLIPPNSSLHYTSLWTYCFVAILYSSVCRMFVIADSLTEKRHCVLLTLHNSPLEW